MKNRDKAIAIENTNEKIQKLNSTLYYDTNEMAHLREKHLIVLEDILEQKDSLYEIIMIENIVRSRLERALISNEKLCKRQSELVEKTGLLFYPDLLQNYDMQIQNIDQTSAKIEEVMLECSKATKIIQKFNVKM